MARVGFGRLAVAVSLVGRARRRSLAAAGSRVRRQRSRLALAGRGRLFGLASQRLVGIGVTVVAWSLLPFDGCHMNEQSRQRQSAGLPSAARLAAMLDIVKDVVCHL